MKKWKTMYKVIDPLDDGHYKRTLKHDFYIDPQPFYVSKEEYISGNYDGYIKKKRMLVDIDNKKQ